MKIVAWDNRKRVVREWRQEDGPPPGPQRETMSLTPPQLFAGLASEGWITEAEARAWAKDNILPQAALNVIASLPEDLRFTAEARLYRLSEARRNDPLVAALAAKQDITEDELDEFFVTYATV